MRAEGKIEFIVNLKQATCCLHFSRFHNMLSSGLSNTLSHHDHQINMGRKASKELIYVCPTPFTGACLEEDLH